MKFRDVAVVAGLGLALTACMKNTYSTGLPASGQVHTQKAQFFAWGLVGEEDVYLDKLCPDGVAWFQNRMEFGDGCMSAITCGIYSPRTIEVKCAGGAAWNLTPMPEHGLLIAEPALVDVGGDL